MGTAVVPKIEMLEIKEPKFLTFAKDGEETAGILQSIESVEMQEKDQAGKPIPGRFKKTARFVLVEGHLDFTSGIFTASGDRVCFLGTSQLVNAIRTDHRGHYLGVRFEGTDSSVTRNGNAMKKFRVWVSSAKPEIDESLSTASALGISDSDIPF